MVLQKHIVFGLDIGSHSIKSAAIDNANGNVLEVFRVELIPDRQSIKQTLNSKDLYSVINSFIKKNQKEFSLSNISINTAIQGNHTTCRYLEFPLLSRNDLELAVPSQAMKHIASSFEDVSYAYAIISPLADDKKRTSVFLIAAPKEQISTLKDILTRCGAVIQRIEVPSMGMIREFEKNIKISDDQFYILVNVGFQYTNIVILSNGNPYFSREFSLAGRDFTYCFQIAENISWQQAETYKHSYDTNMRNFAIEPILLKWMEEIKRSIKYFAKQFNKISVNYKKLFLSGGTAQWRNLDKRLEEHLGVPVEIDNWRSIKYLGKNTENSLPVMYKVAVGLAQEGFDLLSFISNELSTAAKKTKQWWKK